MPPGVLDFLFRKENRDTLASIVKYHVVTGKYQGIKLIDGSGITTTATLLDGETLSVRTVNGTTIIVVNGDGSAVTTLSSFVSYDIDGTNGVVHIIDNVLMPEEAEIPGTIIDTITKSATFPTLLEVMTITDVLETLQAIPGPFTLFAPSELAWKRLPPGTVETLLKEENRESLRSLLLYHVLGKVVSSSDIEDGGSESSAATLLNGEVIDFTVIARGQSTRIKVNRANLAFSDLKSLNGIIHVIDDVLLPQNVTIPLTVLGTLGRQTIFETLLEALEASDLDDVLSASNPLSKYYDAYLSAVDKLVE